MNEIIYTLDMHFDGTTESARELYDRIMDVLGSFGPVAAEPKKTCIHLVRRTAIAGVRVRKDFVLLEFKTDYPIDSPKRAGPMLAPGRLRAKRLTWIGRSNGRGAASGDHAAAVGARRSL